MREGGLKKFLANSGYGDVSCVALYTFDSPYGEYAAELRRIARNATMRVAVAELRSAGYMILLSESDARGRSRTVGFFSTWSFRRKSAFEDCYYIHEFRSMYMHCYYYL